MTGGGRVAGGSVSGGLVRGGLVAGGLVAGGAAVVGVGAAVVVVVAGAAVVVGAAGPAVVGDEGEVVEGGADDADRSMTSPSTFVGLSLLHAPSALSAIAKAPALRIMRRLPLTVSLSVVSCRPFEVQFTASRALWQ
jgi:hypothetical protein